MDDIKRIENELHGVQIGANLMCRFIDRLEKIRDPVVRYMMMTELYRLMFDVAISVFEMNIIDNVQRLRIEELVSPESQVNFEKRLEKIYDDVDMIKDVTRQKLDSFFESMGDWIQSPTYSPDHPLGKKMMNETKMHFDSKK